MHPPHGDPAGAELEACIAAIEQRLAALGDALRENDTSAVERHAGELHRALALAVQRVGHAARADGVSPALRRRLARASGRVAAQRESLARATAALDRAIDVLLPDVKGPGIYSSAGAAERRTCGGGTNA